MSKAMVKGHSSHSAMETLFFEFDLHAICPSVGI